MSLGRMIHRQLSPVTDRVFLTGAGGVTDTAMLLDAKVTHVLNVAAELSHLTYPEHVEVRYVTLQDIESEDILPHLDGLADYVHEVVTSGGQSNSGGSQVHQTKVDDASKIRSDDDASAGHSDVQDHRGKGQREYDESQGRIVVHCVAGVSRSASVCIAYLIKHHNMTLKEAHDKVKAVREVISPNLGFWGALIEYEYQIRGSNSVELLPHVAGTIPSIDCYRKEMQYRIRLGWMDHVFYNLFIQCFFLVMQMLAVSYFEYDFS